MNLLIADSGATKTDWAVIREGKPIYVRSEGLHPFYLDRESSARELRSLFQDFQPDLIRFYGAGCFSDEAAAPLLELLRERFGSVTVQLNDDLHGAAHAFLDRTGGIVSILGTGSASGLFRNGEVIQRVPSLGYILGDEGSAADIGKRILEKFLRRDIRPETARFLESILGTVDHRELTAGLYQSTRPSYYLSTITKKCLREQPLPDELMELVREGLHSFVRHHLLKYEESREGPVVITGGIATVLNGELENILRESGIRNFSICGSVIAGLAAQVSA
ncbi:MAG: hypothetical protein WD355_04905 [Balneolaceae bacterium]